MGDAVEIVPEEFHLIEITIYDAFQLFVIGPVKGFVFQGCDKKSEKDKKNEACERRENKLFENGTTQYLAVKKVGGNSQGADAKENQGIEPVVAVL